MYQQKSQRLRIQSTEFVFCLYSTALAQHMYIQESITMDQVIKIEKSMTKREGQGDK